jgi:hypothetical protein
MNNIETDSLFYEDCYCAFIDILGFSELVKNTSSPKAIVDALNKVKSLAGLKHPQHAPRPAPSAINPSEGELRIGVSYFSDSVVLSASGNEPWALTQILNWSFYLTAELLTSHNLLVRGGIAKGKLYHKDNIVFGPALFRAHQLETNANYPRIILDKGLIEEAIWPDSMTKEEIKKANAICTPIDTDGWRYVDYFLSEIAENNSSYHQVLLNAVNSNQNSLDPRVISKYGWLKNKIDAATKKE